MLKNYKELNKIAYNDNAQPRQTITVNAPKRVLTLSDAHNSKRNSAFGVGYSILLAAYFNLILKKIAKT